MRKETIILGFVFLVAILIVGCVVNLGPGNVLLLDHHDLTQIGATNNNHLFEMKIIPP